jgi:hypothetical protein
MGSKVQSKVIRAQIRNFYKSCDLGILSKKYTLWGLKCNRLPGVMRAQKREIQISHVTKILHLVERTLFFLFSKLILKHVISFMNRKSSCGYAIYFFCFAFKIFMNYRRFFFKLILIIVVEHILSSRFDKKFKKT